MQEADTLRDKWLRKLRSNLAEIVEFGTGEKKSDAEFLAAIIDEYGGVKLPDYQMDYETGQLTNLYDDLQQKYPEKLALLGLTDVVEGAKQANEAFKEALRRRTLSDAEYGKGAMAEARKATEENYRYFVDSVNVEARLDKEGLLTPFIDYLNVEIDRMRKLAGQTPAPAGSGTGSENEDGVKFKTATFNFADGDSVKRNVEVGSILIAPDNTEGYKWKPDVPEFMPATNKTFKEVPIEDREATATFHFFDHTEEEIRQIVGTALTAPENTPGYYWDPEVPAVMPEEDTSYYELPLSDVDVDTDTDETPKYKVTYMKGSEVYAEQEYEAGEVIQAPAAPSGYEWEDFPYRMPAEDITVNAVRRNIPGGGGGSGFE